MPPRQRINGVKIGLHKLSDEEVLSGIEHAEARLETVWQDLAKYNGELALRPNLLVSLEPERYPND